MPSNYDTLKFPFKDMFSDLSKNLQELVKISNDICVQAAVDTNAANLEYRQLEKYINSMEKRPCEKCSSLERCRNELEKALQKKDELICNLFEKVIKKKDELICSLSKCIPKNHDSYDVLTQKAFDSKKVTDDLIKEEKTNADDTITEIESSFLDESIPTVRPNSPVMQGFRANMNRPRSRFKCLSSKRKNQTNNNYSISTQHDYPDFPDFEVVTKPTKFIKTETKTELKNAMQLQDEDSSIVLIPDTASEKSPELNRSKEAKRSLDYNKPNFDKATLKSLDIEELNESKNKILKDKPVIALNNLNLNIMSNNVPILKSKEKASDENEKSKQKTKWNLTRSREPRNDRKFKQTLLTTEIVEKKVDISKLENFSGGLVSRESKQFIQKQNSNSKANPENTFFNPTMTSTSNDFRSEEAKEKIPEINADIVENSFDVIPSTSPKYKYKRDAVRKKIERRKIPGQECDECYKFYERERANLGETQVRKIIEKCSRHRDKFSIRSNTPPGLWNPIFSDDEAVK